MPDQPMHRACIELIFFLFVLKPVRVFVAVFQAVYAVSQAVRIAGLFLGNDSFGFKIGVKSTSKTIQFDFPPGLFLRLRGSCCFSYGRYISTAFPSCEAALSDIWVARHANQFTLFVLSDTKFWFGVRE